VEYLGAGLYRLTPRTGRTHQLRLHMASLGLPIIGDTLYPEVIGVAPDDFSQPLQLLAHSLEFEDPLDGHHRVFVSERKLVVINDGRMNPSPRRSPRDFVPPPSEGPS
jgi:tRNA pseudouridine32 synthase / 23S rRNA pseudouridine746 synthase